MPTDTAIILRSVNYKESDRIYTLYTRDQGKISAIARSARKSAKRFGGALLPYAVFEAVLNPSRRGNGNMLVISEASLIYANEGLGTNLATLGVAGFLLELLREAAPEHESSASLFDLTVQALRMLSDNLCLTPRVLLLSAGMRILAQSGLAMSVGRCNACGKKVPSGRSVYFDAQRGGVVCTACGGGPILLPSKVVDGLVFLEQHSMEEVASLEVDADILQQMLSAFEIFVQMHLEKQLRTPGYLDQLSP